MPGFSLDIVLHKEAWVAKLLGTHLSIQVRKKVKFSRRDNSSLAVKGLNPRISSQSTDYARWMYAKYFTTGQKVM